MTEPTDGIGKTHVVVAHHEIDHTTLCIAGKTLEDVLAWINHEVAKMSVGMKWAQGGEAHTLLFQPRGVGTAIRAEQILGYLFDASRSDDALYNVVVDFGHKREN